GRGGPCGAIPLSIELALRGCELPPDWITRVVMRRSSIVRSRPPAAAARWWLEMKNRRRDGMLQAMPELPEAERAREALERHALGRVVADADDSDSYVCWPWPPGGLREALVGHKVTGVDRVGKQLLLETHGPVPGLPLGMSGSLRFDDDPGLRFKRFALAFTDGTTMVLRDPRRLGRVTLHPARGRLGPEALRVPLARFRDLVGRSRSPVKARLLNQQALAGVGNLLADEALWRAGVAPRPPA